MEMDLSLIDHYDKLLTEVELYITKNAKIHDVHAFYRLRSVQGIGKILALVILYEIHNIERFPTVQDFVSICPAGQMLQRVCRQTLRLLRSQNRQCPSEVGLLRSRGAVSAPQPTGSEISR
jgi:hypothetical protein